MSPFDEGVAAAETGMQMDANLYEPGTLPTSIGMLAIVRS